MKTFGMRILAAVAISTAYSAPASAAPTIYTDRVAFEAAAEALMFESFEQQREAAASQAYGDFTIAETGGNPDLVFINGDLGASSGNSAAFITDNGSSVFSIVFRSDVYAVGFDLLSYDTSRLTIGGAAHYSLTLANGSTPFFGLIDSTGFRALSIDAAGGPTFAIDGLSYASTPAGAVPEPATWAMMIGGMGVVGGAMRRRRVSAEVSFA